MIHAKHPLAKFKVLPFRRSFMQVPPATSCLALHFVCIPGQKGGAINQCPVNCNMSQPWFPIARSGGSILMYSPWRWAEAKKIAEETSPKSSALLRGSDCTNKKCLCSNSVSGCSQFLGSKGAVSASPYTAPEPGMTWHTQGTPATIGEHNPGVWVQGSHEKNSSTLKCPSQNTRNISSETYMFLLGMTTKAGVHHIYIYLLHVVSECQKFLNLSSWCSSRAPVSKPTAKASFCNPLRASCPKTTCRAAPKTSMNTAFR